jgi:nitrogen fixation NifU-like protein
MTENNLDALYRDIILDHYRAPRGKKPLDKTDVQSKGFNPSCGDEITLELKLDNGTVKDIHVDCRGCAISVASGSMLAEILKGRSLEDAKRLAEVVRQMLKGEIVELPTDLGDIDALKGVRNFPVRIKCALLAWVTLMEGLNEYEHGNHKVVTVSTENAE